MAEEQGEEGPIIKLSSRVLALEAFMNCLVMTAHANERAHFAEAANLLRQIADSYSTDVEAEASLKAAYHRLITFVDEMIPPTGE